MLNLGTAKLQLIESLDNVVLEHELALNQLRSRRNEIIHMIPAESIETINKQVRAFILYESMTRGNSRIIDVLDAAIYLNKVE